MSNTKLTEAKTVSHKSIVKNVSLSYEHESVSKWNKTIVTSLINVKYML